MSLGSSAALDGFNPEFQANWGWTQPWRWGSPSEALVREVEDLAGRGSPGAEFDERLLRVLEHVAGQAPEKRSSQILDKLKEILGHLSTSELDRVLCKAARMQVEQEKMVLELCLDLVPLALLKELTAVKQQALGSLIDDLTAFKSFAEEVFENFSQENPSAAQKVGKEVKDHSLSILRYIINFFKRFLNTFIAAHDFNTEQPSFKDQFQAQWILSTFYTILGTGLAFLASLLAGVKALTARFPALPFWAPHAIVSIILLIGYAALRLYQTTLKKAPSALTQGYPNLTEQAAQGRLIPMVGRGDEVKAIADTLGKLDEFSQHPLLVGKSGVGKSVLVKELARQIHEGVHPHLKGKKIFLINTANLKEPGDYGMNGYQSRLEVLLADVKGFEDEVIFFFDEVHTLLSQDASPQSTPDLGQKFKTLLEANRIHCIAATTWKEYAATVEKDEPLARRFRLISIKPLDSQDTSEALTDMINRGFPDVVVTTDAIAKAIQLTDKISPDVAQPSKAKSLLLDVVQSVRQYQGSETQRLNAERDKLTRLRKKFWRENNLSPEAIAKLKSVADEIKRLEGVVESHDKGIEALQSLQLRRNRCKESFLDLARRIKSCKQDEADKVRRAFLGSLLFLQPSFAKVVQERGQALVEQGIPVVVNSDAVAQFFSSRITGASQQG